MKVVDICLWILLLLCMSCSNDRETSEPTLKMDKMADVLYDIALAESYVETYLSKDSAKNKDSLLRVEMDLVFNMHGIDAKAFAQNLAAYKSQPERFQVVLDSANERANRGRTEVFLRRVPKNGNK